MATYGFSDAHGNEIGYFDAADQDAAETYAAEWLERHPRTASVEVWRNERDVEGELPPSFTVER
jgi:hypothetical protein